VEDGKKVDWKDGVEAVYPLLKYKLFDGSHHGFE
jgi:hypothetical protein